jgi:hypothetical protein
MAGNVISNIETQMNFLTKVKDHISLQKHIGGEKGDNMHT